MQDASRQLDSNTVKSGRQAPEVTSLISGATTIFYYDNIALASEFYKNILRLRLVLSLDWVDIFEIAQNCHLALVEGAKGSQLPINGTNKGAILSIVTTDVDAIYGHMVAIGAPFVTPGIKIGCLGRAREFQLRDPGGYTIEYLEWLEPLGRGCDSGDR